MSSPFSLQCSCNVSRAGFNGLEASSVSIEELILICGVGTCATGRRKDFAEMRMLGEGAFGKAAPVTLWDQFFQLCEFR